MAKACPICLRLFLHDSVLARDFARDSAGNNKALNAANIPMVTISSLGCLGSAFLFQRLNLLPQFPQLLGQIRQRLLTRLFPRADQLKAITEKVDAEEQQRRQRRKDAEQCQHGNKPSRPTPGMTRLVNGVMLPGFAATAVRETRQSGPPDECPGCPLRARNVADNRGAVVGK